MWRCLQKIFLYDKSGIFFTPQPLKAVQIFLSSMAPGWVGGGKVPSGSTLLMGVTVRPYLTCDLSVVTSTLEYCPGCNL